MQKDVSVNQKPCLRFVDKYGFSPLQVSLQTLIFLMHFLICCSWTEECRSRTAEEINRELTGFGVNNRTHIIVNLRVCKRGSCSRAAFI